MNHELPEIKRDSNPAHRLRFLGGYEKKKDSLEDRTALPYSNGNTQPTGKADQAILSYASHFRNRILEWYRQYRS